MNYQKIFPTLIFAVSGCAGNLNGSVIFSEFDRGGYSDAWYYERLTPYYSNDIFLKPHVHLRAVKELVGIPWTFDDGTEGHADVERPDIELFFAAPVTNIEDRDVLMTEAIKITCPQTDLNNLNEKIAYFNQTYVVIQGVACLGHAS